MILVHTRFRREGKVHADFAGRKLGAQRINVERLRAGKNTAVLIHLLEIFNNLRVWRKVELSGLHVKTKSLIAAQGENLPDGTVKCRFRALEVQCKAVNALGFAGFGNFFGVINHFLQRCGRALNARFGEEVLVVNQTQCQAGIGQRVQLAVKTVHIVKLQTAEFCFYILAKIAIDRSKVPFFDKFGGVAALHAKHIRRLVAGECNINALRIVLGHDRQFYLDVFAVGFIELIDQFLDILLVMTVISPIFKLYRLACRCVAARIGRWSCCARRFCCRTAVAVVVAAAACDSRCQHDA
ncbi:hypothetical protein D3C75_348890 [compost metagenome]